jgi:hypothetical protein
MGWLGIPWEMHATTSASFSALPGSGRWSLHQQPRAQAGAPTRGGPKLSSFAADQEHLTDCPPEQPHPGPSARSLPLHRFLKTPDHLELQQDRGTRDDTECALQVADQQVMTPQCRPLYSPPGVCVGCVLKQGRQSCCELPENQRGRTLPMLGANPPQPHAQGAPFEDRCPVSQKTGHLCETMG